MFDTEYFLVQTSEFLVQFPQLKEIPNVARNFYILKR